MKPFVTPTSPLLSSLLCLSTLLGACNLTSNPTTSGNPITPPGLPNPEVPIPPSSSLNAQTCKSKDPEFQCLKLKIISYDTETGGTVITEQESNRLIGELNQVWSPCKIGFEIESYERLNPATRGLSMNPNWRTEGSQIRSAFNDQQSLLVVAVGNFSASTIAVTEMPGYGPYGTLVESSYAKNALTVGHELGHYMGLYHIRNTSNLMNPYIGPHTEFLSESQCSIARSTNNRYWTSMME